MSKNSKLKLWIIALVPIIILINTILKGYPQFVEKYYSNSIDKIIRQALSLITSIFPFSFAEILIIALVIILIVQIVNAVIKIIKGGFLNGILNLLSYASILFILFMVFWGFNYDRLSLDKIAGLKIEKSSEKELYNLCEDLINRANELRWEVNEDSRGIMAISGGEKSIFKNAFKGYEKASEVYPVLGGKYGSAKPILLSPLMSYTGITGIYIPYTGEANVNMNVPIFTLPSTASHEMAHQRGFAREDEANYISYVACTMNPDKDFQYSGVMLALLNSMDALANKDFNAYKELTKKYSAGVKRDIEYNNAFWSKYEGKVEKISDSVNNSYLKSNGQKDGVESYGRMVDLLLAEYRTKNKK